ncbi:hypothetical protein NIES2107_68690 (plasmid) [Nostoc carneum NIES-2107]|nr:hypothetical protein NIES2107_68690 [Nostoc carneum NIES-2107]
MGNRAWGMGKNIPMPNAQSPMPQAAGRLSLSTHKGMEFPAAFNKTASLFSVDQIILAKHLPQKTKPCLRRVKFHKTMNKELLI